MGFDLQGFKKMQFHNRTQEVRVEELADFFEGDPVWIVRGLTGEEWAKVQEAADNTRNLAAVAEALSGTTSKEKAAALRELLGVADKVPAELVKRFEMLTLGSVEPKVDREIVVKLAANYPTVLYTLTNAILRLTGLGREPGKPKGSGKTPESEPPSPSATSGADSSTK